MSQINESAIKTPGVYVNEIPSFPPSIAQVATAVPAFVGYTEDDTNLQPGDLHNVPTRISSLVEYQLYFGNGPDPGITEVDIDAANTVTNVKRTAKFYLYDSVRMFFLNGGSVCYIVSVGRYTPTPAFDLNDFKSGLDAVSKYDEPTLLLFPDAVLGTALYAIQDYALTQCSNLQDRFCIFDLYENSGWANGRDDFRNSIGVQNLNYGAAYTPYLQTNLGLTIKYKNLKGLIFQAGVAIDLKNFTNSNDAKNTVESLNRLVLDTATINANVTALLTGTNLDLEEQWTSLVNDYQSSFSALPTPTDNESKFQALVSFIYSTGLLVNNWALNLNGDFAGNGLKKDAGDLITNSLKSSMTTLLALDQGATTELGSGYYGSRSATLALFTATQWGDIFGAGLPAANTAVYGAAPEASQRQRALPSFITVFNQFNLGVSQMLSLVSAYEANYEQALLLTHPVYKQIVTAVQNTSSTLPPSGAIAGVYTATDATRGVWKAPANVSVTGVTGLTYAIDDATQGDLNIDTIAGKSLNAIRAFTGKGIIVWGARTLDGNSNDFRYISVRRFYIMVEESVKKATMQFVFEPNDGNTWVRLRAMIENYLTNLWRLGALAGSKPEQAFYVKVGLGQTMTFDDILNGRLIVEIGMAPVRPAEFIILRFSQIQQQA
ncbi:MAG TPA: phage tail sheath C-terminal domain-containing protein [Chitinophagaceae bacterium]|nr:phage tail sheath C-terminal domain-containing protein [Chitinophagaceae bacterium]